ncbi:hypothetical protein P3T36_001877 [Kitasatospora sp. MAP12-15]|uniref:hypothetical protein n=1 Tax=unclassified Kitasatospora TaxID=2633591 RepID=UPI0024745870|nr:hypothetical protein [Kitasatospora sp. MAP12-44]MDH6113238.1 hypothetical protein [Kitasatospora sp. MAP12-44]
MILTHRRTRVWVADGKVHWRQGRTTTVVPGGRVRRVEVSGQVLALHLFDEQQPLTVRHRIPEAVSTLASEIEALIGDTPGDLPAVRSETPSVWPVRAVRALGAWIAGVARAARRTTVKQRCWLGYLFVVVPMMIGTGTPDRPGFLLALLTAAGYGVLRLADKLAKPRTRWILARRGVTVQTKAASGKGGVLKITYHSLDGERHTLDTTGDARHWSEIRFDPRDPTRFLFPTRALWIFELLGGLLLAALGAWLLTPLLSWVLELVP